MTILVCGSLAYDCIMVFNDQFKKHILPDKIHILNVSFLVPELRREFGGCAGNIAYNLSLLGEGPTILATVGLDFDPYRERLETLGLTLAGVRRLTDQYTAQCFITTDLDDNQITAFHPGAMVMSHTNPASAINGVTLAIVAPDGREGMLSHANDLTRAKVPFIFDPGQAMPLFSGSELLHFLELARYATFNDYEASLLCERTGRSLSEIAGMVEALVVTKGGEGSTIYAEGEEIAIPIVKPERLVDPTGCGDAYRAGLLYGIKHGWEWRKSGQLASLLGSIKIAHRGGQNHQPVRAEIGQRYAAAFGESPW